MDKPASVSDSLTNTVDIFWSIFDCVLYTGFHLYQRPLQDISWVNKM